MHLERVIAYVDGYNLYHGLRQKRWKSLYWVNIQDMVKRLLRPHQSLVATKYFTTRIREPEAKRKRQAVYLEALQTLPDFHVFYGHFLAETVVCRQCAHSYVTHHEKMTDVNIAVELLSDAFQDQLDTALLVSGDGDLAAVVRAVRRLFTEKRVVVAFPPARVSKALTKAANGHTRVGRNVLAASQFPDSVAKLNGFALHRPDEWR